MAAFVDELDFFTHYDFFLDGGIVFELVMLVGCLIL